MLHGLLDEHGDAVEVEDLALPVAHEPGLTAWEGDDFDARVSRAARILPDAVMDGFFLCRVRKLASVAEEPRRRRR